MIDYHRFCQIKHLHAHQGLNASQIAKEVALDRRTVAYWLTQDHFRPRKPRQHASKLDPFKPEIVRLLERHGLVRITQEPRGKRKVKVPRVSFQEIALKIAI